MRAIPTTFIIDPTGKITKRLVGFHAKSVFEKEITALLPQVQASPK